jgi:hypothetical protein
MPWSDPNPTPDQLKRRIAILIRRRCREQGVKQIAMRALVHRDTVRAYSDAAFHAKTSNGPVIFETIVSILKATGDHPGQVLWAAMESSDEKSFMEMLATDMAGQISAMGSNVIVVLATQFLLGIGYILAAIYK